MSKPKTIKNNQEDLFQNRLSTLLNPKHPLLVLAERIDWEGLEADLSLKFSENKPGQPALPIRLVTGLLMLQHMEGLSDEAVVTKWIENPYWQYFCGYDFLQWDVPMNPSSLVRWRKRLGEEGLEKILACTLQVAVKTELAQAKDFEKVIVDTTVMEANISYPTDSKLLNQARHKLVSLAKAGGIKLRQSYARVGKKAAIKACSYAHAKQFKRMNKEIKKLKVYLGRVVRDISRKLSVGQQEGFDELLNLSNRLLSQTKKSKDKVYSIHSPHVYCIAKGKAKKPYEFGVKVSLVLSHKKGIALSAQALERSFYDGHTLESALENALKVSGQKAKEVFVDRGYRGHKIKDHGVYISGQKRGMTPRLKRDLRRRSSIEPHIGHIKSEGKLGRNFLKGVPGAKLNALLCAVGHNLRLILNHLKRLLLSIIKILLNWHPKAQDDLGLRTLYVAS